MSKYQYRLVEKRSEHKDKFRVLIKADSNDADYITETSYYTKKDFEDYILAGLIDLRENASGRHKLKDYVNQYDLELPYSDWGSCHTLKKVEVDYIDEHGKIWGVVY